MLKDTAVGGGGQHEGNDEVSARLAGRVAVVTGGAQGIGEGIVRRLVDDGAGVLIADRDLDRAQALAAELGEAVHAAAVDVGDPDSVRGLPAATEAAFGRAFDLFVSNAGIQTFQRGVDLTVSEWDAVLDVNARGLLLCLQTAARAMTPARPGAPDAPAFVAIASIQARLPGPYYPHYSASKAAVLSLVKSFAVELAPAGIRVNAVAPGIVTTALWDRADAALSSLTGRAPGDARRERIDAVPLKRPGTPEDIAAATAFLLSGDASYITGECIHVCGGDVML